MNSDFLNKLLGVFFAKSLKKIIPVYTQPVALELCRGTFAYEDETFTVGA